MIVWHWGGVAIHVEALLWMIGALAAVAAALWHRQDVRRWADSIRRDGRNGEWLDFIRIRRRTARGLFGIAFVFLLIGVYSFTRILVTGAQSEPYDASRVILNGLFFAANGGLIYWALKDVFAWRSWLARVEARIVAALEAREAAAAQATRDRATPQELADRESPPPRTRKPRQEPARKPRAKKEGDKDG